MTLLVGSTNARVGFDDGMAILRDGGSAIDAVVATIRRVEANADDHSVGYSGLPNLLGDVELDASIMDGRNLATGAVAALKNHQDAIDLARAVMDTLPHVLIVGDGARMLAAESGLPERTLLTPEAEAIWRSRLAADDEGAYQRRMRELATRMSRDPERPLDAHGTVNVIARDRKEISPAASAPPAGPGSTPAASATPPSSAPATTPTTAGAPPPALAAARWPSGSAPPTAS